VRFEGRRSAATRALFVTEGVLLRMLSSDDTLRQYDAIVLDEVRHGLTVPTRAYYGGTYQGPRTTHVALLMSVPTTHYLLLTTYSLLSTYSLLTHYLLTTYYLLLTTCDCAY
jgi:hypothetical protein